MMSKTTFESIDSLLLSPKENKLVVQTLGKNKKVSSFFLMNCRDISVDIKVDIGLTKQA